MSSPVTSPRFVAPAWPFVGPPCSQASAPLRSHSRLHFGLVRFRPFDLCCLTATSSFHPTLRNASQQRPVKFIRTRHIDSTVRGAKTVSQVLQRVCLTRCRLPRRCACVLWQAASSRSTTLAPLAFLCSSRTTLKPPLPIPSITIIPLSRHGYHTPTFLRTATA